MSFKSFWGLLDSYTTMQISTKVVSNHGAYKSKFIHKKRAYPVRVLPRYVGSGEGPRVLSSLLAVQGGWFEPRLPGHKWKALPLRQARPSLNLYIMQFYTCHF